MHINGATPGSASWALGEYLLSQAGGGGQAAGAEGIVGSAIVNGFDDQNAGALEALGGGIGLALGGPAGAAFGLAIGYAIAGLVGGANDGSSSATGVSGPTHGGPT